MRSVFHSVPFAKLIGWREIFLFIALLGAIALLGLSLALRAIAPPGKHSLKERLAPLRQKAVLTTLLITFLPFARNTSSIATSASC